VRLLAAALRFPVPGFPFPVEIMSFKNRGGWGAWMSFSPNAIHRVSFAAYLDKGVEQVLSKCGFFRKMRTARRAAIRDVPPPPAQPFISPVQHTYR
jgi:hypothetical protein